MIFDEGYGLANRVAHLPNGPQTEYGLANATTTALLTADVLQGHSNNERDRSQQRC